jgi:hypothetical protein
MKQFSEMKDVCFENLHSCERLEDDIDCIYEEALYLHEQNETPLKEICDSFNNIVVYKKDKAKFNTDMVFDYLSDNYAVESSDELEGLDELEKAVEIFNNKQTRYTSSKPVGIMDCSNELYSYILEEHTT